MGSLLSGCVRFFAHIIRREGGKDKAGHRWKGAFCRGLSIRPCPVLFHDDRHKCMKRFKLATQTWKTAKSVADQQKKKRAHFNL